MDQNGKGKSTESSTVVTDQNGTQHNIMLPPTHFLASLEQTSQTHDFFNPSSGQFHLRPDVSTVASADFDIDVRSGFLPPEEPITRLPSEWNSWEDTLSEARKARASDTLADVWSEKVLKMPLLGTDNLDTVPLLRRAAIVLGFLAHYYLHACIPARNTIPSVIAIPWMAVSKRLGMPPVIAYAHVVLWNWRFRDPLKGFSKDNFEIVETFTETDSERHFYLVSLLIEARGASALRLMSRSLDEAFVGDDIALRRIGAHLDNLAEIIADSNRILATMRAGCDPSEFYWNIRPYWSAGKLIYEGVGENGESEEKNLSGASAGQSSMIQAYDAFLGVEHISPSNNNDSAPSQSQSQSTMTPNPQGLNETFIQRMRLYMPHHHRAFLAHLNGHRPSIRDVIVPEKSEQNSQSSSIDAEIIESTQAKLDRSILEVKKFRDTHFRIVSMYIISQSRHSPPVGCRFVDQCIPEQKGEEMKGTGGTDLVKFLKGTRARTVQAMVHPQ